MNYVDPNIQPYQVGSVSFCTPAFGVQSINSYVFVSQTVDQSPLLYSLQRINLSSAASLREGQLPSDVEC